MGERAEFGAVAQGLLWVRQYGVLVIEKSPQTKRTLPADGDAQTRGSERRGFGNEPLWSDSPQG